jgi:hypothetical protein
MKEINSKKRCFKYITDYKEKLDITQVIILSSLPIIYYTKN